MRGQWTCLNGPTASNCLNREGPATVRDDARLIVWGDDFPKALQAAHKAATFVCFVILETCVLFDVFFSVQADRTVTCQLFIIPCLCVCIQSLHCSMMTSDHRFRSVSTSTTVLQTLWSAIFDRWSNKSWNSRSFHSLSPLVKLDVKQKESSLKTGCIWFELWQARILQSSLHFAYLLWSQRWQPLPWRRRGQSKGIKMN